MNTTTTTRKIGALVDFRPTNPDGYFASWRGEIISKNGNPVLDRQTGEVARYICKITFVPSPVIWGKSSNDGHFRLVTQGAHKGSRRYRTGTFAEMIEAAEKWAARRFYSEADA